MMEESYFKQIKKEDKTFSFSQTYPKQNKKKDLDEIDTKVIPHFSYPLNISSDDEFQIRSPKLTPKLFIGNQSISKSFLEDKKLIERVKKHLDQEYLEKYRNKYTFNPSPPRPEIHEKNSHNPLNMVIQVSTLNQKTPENTKKSNIKNPKNNSSSQFKKIKKKSEKNDSQQNPSNIRQTNKPSSIDNDDLPIALRRTKRPITKPLRYWLGEKIVYTIDEETGCYTKSYELIVNENQNTVEKQEFIVERNSSRNFIAKDKSKNFLVESGEVFIIINGKIFKGSSGCKFCLVKGQKMTLDNKSDDDAKLSFI